MNVRTIYATNYLLGVVDSIELCKIKRGKATSNNYEDIRPNVEQYQDNKAGVLFVCKPALYSIINSKPKCGLRSETQFHQWEEEKHNAKLKNSAV